MPLQVLLDFADRRELLDGLIREVIRRVLPTSPVRVEYELTAAGRDLEHAVRVISAWAEKWLSI